MYPPATPYEITRSDRNDELQQGFINKVQSTLVISISQNLQLDLCDQ